LNRLGFGMLTVGTAMFHWLYFDNICWLVPVATNSSVCIQPRLKLFGIDGKVLWSQDL
jgi:hypothetical protein